MKRLSRLLLIGGYLLFSGVILADEVNNSALSSETVISSQITSLSDQETQYIIQECQSFANEDNISPEQQTDYLKTCVKELSIAVKNAIKQLAANSESIVSDDNENNTIKDNK